MGESAGLSTRHRRFHWSALLLPGALWLLLLFLVPLGLVLAVSFAGTNIVGLPVYGFHLDNYRQVFQAFYVPTVLRTLLYAGAATALSLMLGYPSAYAIARYGGRWRNLLIGLVILPWFVDYLVRIYAWVAVLSNGGVVNRVLHAVGFGGSPPVQFLGHSWAVVSGLTYSYIPFMVLPVYAAIEQLDASHIEAGKDLYAGPWSTFRYVTWPMTLSGVVAGCILTFLPALGDFANAQILGGPNTVMIGSVISEQFSSASGITFGAAMACILMLALLILIVFYLWVAARRRRSLHPPVRSA